MEKFLENVAVIGAGGKMGSGIALVLLQEMALASEKFQKNVKLKLIDANEESLPSLKNYLLTQMIKYSEKNIVTLREIYKDNMDLISNQEVIDHFVMKAMDFLTLTISLEEVTSATIIFEAIVEDYDVKCQILKTISALCSAETFFLSNTSSIPISSLDKGAELNNRIVGFHFYNPPAIQKLVEIVFPEDVNPELAAFADTLATKIKKTVVHSPDVAGFIGNGHFIPEAIYACKQVRELAKTMPLHEAIYLVDQITKKLLLRPMGIFQLIDYVGIDVTQKIASTMRHFLKNNSLQDPLIDQMVENKLLGGQHSDGSQKEGFFKYAKTDPNGFYDFTKLKYLNFENADWAIKLNAESIFHSNGCDWKTLSNNKNRNIKIQEHFNHLRKSNSYIAKIAIEFLDESMKIARLLVENGEAYSLSDVSTVLKLGFLHLYGPEDL